MIGFWRELLPWRVDGHILCVSLYGFSSVCGTRELWCPFFKGHQSNQIRAPLLGSHFTLVRSLSRVRLCDPKDYSLQAPLSMGFSRQEYWSGLLFPLPRDLPDPEIKPMSPALAGGFFITEPPGKLQPLMGLHLEIGPLGS